MNRIIETFWGQLTHGELVQLALLSITHFFLIGAYWVMRLVRDTMFETMIGISELPDARLYSVIVTVPLVWIYGVSIDYLSRHHLGRQIVLYVIFMGYGTIFAGVALLSQVVSVTTPTAEGRIVGYINFFAVETFGSLTFAAFWSYVAEAIPKKSAPKLFPFITMMGQLGSIFGPVIAGFCMAEFSFQFGAFISYAFCGVILFISSLVVFFFSRTVPDQQQQKAEDEQKKEKKAEMTLREGLGLLWKDSYVRGIFAISTIYHIISTITDYQMKRLAKEAYPDPTLRTEYMASFGFFTNVVSFTFALFGTSFLLRQCGLTLSLLLYPFCVLMTLFWNVFDPHVDVIYVSLVILKGLSYALNNPAKETLYTITNVDVKYKVKSWIDMFGQRFAKGVGALITKSSYLSSLDDLLFRGSLVSIVMTIVWMGEGYQVGQQFEKSKD